MLLSTTGTALGTAPVALATETCRRATVYLVADTSAKGGKKAAGSESKKQVLTVPVRVGFCRRRLS